MWAYTCSYMPPPKSSSEPGEQNPARFLPCLGERSHQVHYGTLSVVTITFSEQDLIGERNNVTYFIVLYGIIGYGGEGLGLRGNLNTNYYDQ